MRLWEDMWIIPFFDGTNRVCWKSPYYGIQNRILTEEEEEFYFNSSNPEEALNEIICGV